MTLNKLMTASLVALGLSFGAAPAMADSFDLQATIQASHPDLEAARLDAVARGDILASQCYAGVETFLDNNPLPNLNLPTPVGVISGFQATRDAVKNAQKLKALASQGTPVALEEACGPLEMDARSDVNGIIMDLTLFGVKIF